MIHLIRLARPLNLLIIALTMYGLGWYFNDAVEYSENTDVQSVYFFLLVFSTVLIAAAGNIINDYFDVKADRVNKPERLIIGKHLKRRVAIVAHWGLNFVAFSIAIFLSWKLETYWYVFIHLLSINILWYYSSYFKRKLFTGNILIAGLTALVPLLVGLYFYQSHQLLESPTQNYFIYPFDKFRGDKFIVFLSFALAGFAFLLNFAREVVKDMEDVEGDQLIRAKTVPIVFGFKKSKLAISVILFSAIAAIAFFFVQFKGIEPIVFLFVGISTLLIIIAFVLLLKANEKSNYKMINACIKLAMVFGLLSPIYWKLLIIYG
ncbi:MAG: 4-hydroxybenzoate polyprenyltransferase [Crocinitomicaceae bacterium]|jgi:4-hydroxybenzoate polyprenyltransferase